MFEWYQCDILRKSGQRDFWCRFIAQDPVDAKLRIEAIKKAATTGKLKSFIYRWAYNRYVEKLDIYRVPDTILRLYDLNSSKDVDLFYRKERG